MYNLAAMIITKNEEIHIQRCINSVIDHVDAVFVIDSGSIDKTTIIAEKLGAVILKNKWTGYSNQINWAIKKISPLSKWILRIDADEIIEKNGQFIKNYIKNINPDINGITIKRNMYFDGDLVRYGGVYNRKILRIFRSGYGFCDNKLMDEHIVVKPKIIDSKFVFCDKNLNGFNHFISKHIRYAELESKANLNLNNLPGFQYSSNTNNIRLLKKNIFMKINPRLRPFLYLFYRLILRGGILDKDKAYYFHIFQSFFYRSMVEYKKLK